MQSSNPDESALIRAFVRPDRRDRFLEQLANPRRRRRLLDRLDHFADLDPRYRVELPPAEASAEGIERKLRELGAGETCHVVSTRRALDGRRLPLREALDEVVGAFAGALLSCVPGELAYYEGEHAGDRCLLVRPRA